MPTQLESIFARGELTSNGDLTRAFGRNMGGIRYRGSTTSAIQTMAVIILPSSGRGRVRHPYSEEISGSTVSYMGEGLLGDQLMKRGNLALLQQVAQQFPLFIFVRVATNQYRSLGRARVVGFRETQHDDRAKHKRRVYVYDLLLEEQESQAGARATARPKPQRASPLRLSSGGPRKTIRLRQR